MKMSAYNFFYPYDTDSNQYIAYNSFTNALALMSVNQYQEFECFQKNNNYPLNDSQAKDLLKGGFIISDNVDEHILIRERLLRSRYSNSTLGLTLAPTSGCNFRCVYCFEKDKESNVKMAEETQQNIIALIKKYIPGITALSITWYGGEPLLALDIIEDLSRKLIKIADDFNLKYSAYIVTNGYLLTEENAERLVRCKVTHCQVTIDGDEKAHNLRRPLINGKATYATILNNIQAAQKVLPISLRVNTDKNNQDAALQVDQLINDHHLKNVRVYPAPVDNTDDCYNADLCLSNQEFMNIEYKFLLSTKNPNFIRFKYPQLRGNICGADTIASFVINADGEMYKCWSDIGCKEYSLGNINTGVFNIMNEIHYLMRDPTSNPECSLCKFLPICMGGCPHKAQSGRENQCIYFDNIFQLYITAIAKSIRKNNDKLNNSCK